MLLPEDKEFITMLIQGVKAEIKYTNDILGKDISVIKEQTLKTNSRVNHHDEDLKEIFKVIDTRSTNCPNIADYRETKKEVEALRTESITKKEIKKFVVSSVLLTSTIITIIFTIGKIFFGL